MVSAPAPAAGPPPRRPSAAPAASDRPLPTGRAGPAGADRMLGIGALVFFVLAIALSYLPGQASVPPLDRDEPRYTQATKQMIETGDLVRIRFQDAPRHKKPIGIHWLQAGAVTLSGAGAAAPLWVYRLPSLAGAVAALLLAAWTARAFLPTGPSLLVGALLGATIILGVEARLAKTDAVLLATILAAQGALARIWLASRRDVAMPLVFWTAVALGILVKGPIAPMVSGLTVATLAVLDGRALLARLRPLLGVALVALIALPWFVAIYRATGGAFFEAALGRDFLGKAATGQEGHWAPPLTHAALFLLIAWPLSPFALAAVAGIWRRRGPVFLFALAWVVPSWTVFELVPTKLPHYTLPLVPAIALAAVAALSEARPPRWLQRMAAVHLALVPVALLVAVPAGFVAFATPVPWTAVALAAVSAAAALAAAAALWRGVPPLSAPVLAPALAAAVVAQGAVWGLALPALAPIWVSPRLVATAAEVAGCDEPRLVSVGFNEPSMIFLAGTDTALAAPREAVALAADGCVVTAARERYVPELRQAAAEAGVPLAPVAVVEGFNISKGEAVRLTLFVRR